MIKPVNSHFDRDRNATVLYFPDESSAEYDIKGAICFPVSYEFLQGIHVDGFALIAGQDVATKKVTVFEQRKFVVIDSIVNPATQAIEFPGLAPWFNEMWAKYYGRKFFYHQEPEIVRKYHLEIIRSPMIQPKPGLVEIDWQNDDDALHTVWRYIATKRFTAEKGSELQNQFEMVKATEKKQVYPAVRALECLLMAYDKYPWREPA